MIVLGDWFWKQVYKTPSCWLWQGRVDKDGYGYPFVAGRNERAHRLVLSEKLGRDVDLYALHTCNNSRCVNPEHLYEGTQKQNIQDCIAAGNFNNCGGEKHTQSKLTDAQVRQIRLFKSLGGYTIARLASKFGVCSATITLICNRTTWRHL